MKLLHISNYYYPHIGGIEQVARDCVNALTDEYSQEVICFNHEKGDVVDYVDGVKITRVGCFAKISSQSLALGYKKALFERFSTFAPDVVVFHYPNPFVAHYLLKILKKFPQCKLITYWHLDITKQKILGKFFKGQSYRLLDRSYKVIATSPNYIDGSEYLTAFRDKCIVVQNCANADRVTLTDAVITRSAEIRRENEGKVICFAVGRHVPYKGMEYLIRAGKLIDDEFRIYIGGEGPLTESLKQLASGDGKIVFLGKLSDDELKAYLNACDIFCFPSITKNEAFGLALAEAMSFGKPCVTFTIPGSGVNYVSLGGITGIEVPNADIVKYAEALRRLAGDASLREAYGAAAAGRFNEHFTYDTFRRNIRELIKDSAQPEEV